MATKIKFHKKSSSVSTPSSVDNGVYFIKTAGVNSKFDIEIIDAGKKYFPNYLSSDHPASVITNTNITNWNTAFGWGNHANAGYVPYTGATANVNLGARSITSTGGFIGNASTATTLATSRTINGTSFNGSANITTANWGTARNITIGNTTKSVNGSGNVSWSLAEIGINTGDFVPYTGANQALDLNSQNLSMNGIFNTNSGFLEKKNLLSATSGSFQLLQFENLGAISDSVGNDNGTTDRMLVIEIPTNYALMYFLELELFQYSPQTEPSNNNYNRHTNLYIQGYSNVPISHKVKCDNPDFIDKIEVRRIDSTKTFFYVYFKNLILYPSVYFKRITYRFQIGSSVRNSVKSDFNMSFKTTADEPLYETVNNSQFTRDSYLWNKGNFNPAQYVLQTSLNTQLANYVPINGVKTINNTKTFTSSPIVPNATLDGHAVNLGQLNILLGNNELNSIVFNNSTNNPTNSYNGLDADLTLNSSRLFFASGVNTPVNAGFLDTTVYSNSAFQMAQGDSDNFYFRRRFGGTWRPWNQVASREWVTQQIGSISIPIVNDGQLTLSTGTGLSGSGAFTANQAGGSTFSVAVASTHKLPTTAEWNALPTTNTITRLRGTTSGTYTSGDLTLLAGANTTITQSGANITIASTDTNTTYTAGNGLTLSGTAFSLPVTDSGSGDYVTNVVANANGLTVSKSILPVNSLVTSSSATGTSNVATTNTNTFLNIVRGGSSAGSSTQVTGSGSVTVSSDANGKLTITGTNTNTTYTAGNGLTLSGTVFSLPITTSGTGNGVASITQTTNGITQTLANFALSTHTHTFASLTSKPTTLSGYGITDAMSISHVANGITSANITNWNNAFTNSHSHGNISYLNTINQNLGTGNNVQFVSLELSATTPYIDFHHNDSTDDYTSRIIEWGYGQLRILSKDSLSYHLDGKSTPSLLINKYGVVIGKSDDNMFESVALNTVYGSLTMDDSGAYFGGYSTVDFNKNINVYGEINSIHLRNYSIYNGDPLTGNGLLANIFGTNTTRNGIALVRTTTPQTSEVFTQWGAGFVVQTNDTYLTVSSSHDLQNIVYMSGGSNSQQTAWKRRVAWTNNDVQISAPSFKNTSLRKYKTNIKPFKNSALELVNSLDVMTFNRIDTKEKDVIGVIADDTKDEFLTEDKEGIDLYKTLFIQAKAIQELNQKVKELETLVNKMLGN